MERMHPRVMTRGRPRFSHGVLCGLLLLCGALSNLKAAASLDALFKETPRAIRSASQQFITHDLVTPPSARQAPAPLNKAPEKESEKLADHLVRLGPESVGVSAERIKKRFLILLDLPDQWRGVIHIVLRPTERTDELPRIATSRFADGWRYRIDLPAVTDALAVVRSIVQVLLIEVANRGASDRAAEIPLWLQEALTRQIFFEGGRSWMLQPETSVLGTLRHRESEEISRSWLLSHPGLTFTEISFPTSEMLTGDAFVGYQACAHLFFLELSRLSQGPQRLRAFVANLGAFWNWQTPFFKAFEPELKTPLDVEKWWSVALLRPSMRDIGEDKIFESNRQKLNEVLQVHSEIRFDPEQIPGKTRLGLSEMIREWDYSKQKPVLQEKINQLTILQWVVTPDWLPLIQRYRKALLDYVDKRDAVGQAPEQRGGAVPRARYIVDDAVRELEKLERERISRKPASMP